MLEDSTPDCFEGMKSLAETLTDRENIARDILAQLDSATDPWGIKVHACYSWSTGCVSLIVRGISAWRRHFETKCVKYQSCRLVWRVLSQKDKGLRADGDEQRPIPDRRQLFREEVFGTFFWPETINLVP